MTVPARYGFVPNVPLYCDQCRHARSYNVLAIRCSVCSGADDVRYGVESRRPVRCGRCSEWRDLVVWPAPSCSHADCEGPLTYGLVLGKPLCCAAPHSKAKRTRHGYFVVTRAPCVGADVCLALLAGTHPPDAENNTTKEHCTGRPCVAIATDNRGEPLVCQQCAATVRRHFTRNKLTLPRLTHI